MAMESENRVAALILETKAGDSPNLVWSLMYIHVAVHEPVGAWGRCWILSISFPEGDSSSCFEGSVVKESEI